MRLRILDEGHSRKQKVMLWMARRFIDPVPGPILTMSYRPRFFGRNMSRALQEAMRGSKRWSWGEAELFCAFVSRANQCEY